MTRRPSPLAPSAALGSAASAALGGIARLRGRKPLHPRGLVLPAQVDRDGAGAPLGAAWLDRRGTSRGVVRLSRSAGLPDGWPDVWGVALRVPVPAGVADLLFSQAGIGIVARHVLTLRREPRPPFSAVLPYRTASGAAVVLGAVADGPLPELSSDRAALAGLLARTPLRLALVAARPGGPWRRYGSLTVGGEPLGSGDGEPAGDQEISFDPVLHPLPGLALPGAVARVRARAYAGARAGRRADPAALDRHPGDLEREPAADPLSR